MNAIIEQRQRARISWRFWVAVEGVDDYPRLRNGNISLNGVYFEVDRPIGAPGSVQWLYLSGTEQGQPVEVLARVIRVATVDDVRRGSVPVGVALEFMPERADVRRQLQDLVREVGTMQLEEREAIAAGQQPARIERRPLSVQDIQLETDWQFAVGETVNFEMRVRQTGRRGLFEGKVVEVVPLPDQRARVRVQVVQEEDAELVDRRRQLAEQGAERREVVELLFADLDAEQPVARGEQLVGSLARIRLASLLSFFELERISGELQLDSGAERAQMYFVEGQLVDVAPASESPKADVARLLGWTDGTFEFQMRAVDRPDRIGITTTALLLELALAQDKRSC